MKVNDKITFGTYPQIKYTDERQPLEWRVLAVEGDKALVITDKVIDQIRFNEKYADVTWETSIARDWANGEFYNDSFSDAEKAKIVKTHLTTPDNAKWGTKGGNDTDDNVFCLSLEELDKYMPDVLDRRGEPSPKAIEHKIYVYTETGYATWWLRSSGYVQYAASRVACGGTIADMIYDDVRAHHGIRPAMWIKVD